MKSQIQGWNQEWIRKWIQEGTVTLETLDKLRGFVHTHLAKELTVSKLRRFYETVVQMRAHKDHPQMCQKLAYKMIVLLRYDAGREKQQSPSKEALNTLVEEVVKVAIKTLEEGNWHKQQIRNFLDLMEAIVAFHREKAKPH